MSEAMVVENEELGTTETKREPFVVDDDSKAEWCMEQIGRKKAELAKWKDHFDAQFEGIKRQLESDIAWFEGSLWPYFAKLRADGLVKKADKSVSYKLPAGKLVLKQQEPEYDKDDDKIVKWLEKNSPEFVKVKKTPDWQGLKNTLVVSGETMVTEDGEVVPGIKVIARDDVFKVEVK